MPDNELLKALEPIFEKYGQEAVKAAVLDIQPRQKRIKDKPGAPKINRRSRDAVIYTIIQLVRLGCDHNVAWCCNHVSKNIGIRLRERRGGIDWVRNYDNVGNIRRIYYRAKKDYETNEEFRNEVATSAAVLIWWRETAVNMNWGYMHTMRPVGTGFGFAPSLDIIPSNPKLLSAGIDRLKNEIDDLSSN